MKKELPLFIIIPIAFLSTSGCDLIASIYNELFANNEFSQFSSVYEEKPQPILLTAEHNVSLHEDYYYFSDNTITVSRNPAHIVIYFHLKNWDGDYGLELMFMTESDFEDFRTLLGDYSAYHTAYYSEGTYKWELYVDPGVYRFVVDNTDKGWEMTDFDFEDDVAIFDYEIYEIP